MSALTDQHIAELALESSRGDAAARARLIEGLLPLARSLARRYAGSPEPREDLEQVAAMGLVKAVNRYRPGAGRCFLAYAVPTIVGEIRRYLRDRSWPIHLPRAVKDAAFSTRRAVIQLEAELGRPPALAEIARVVNLSEEAVEEALAALREREVAELDATLAAPADAGDHAAVLDRVYLDQLLAGLDDRKRHILALRFVRDLTQGEIAEIVGISQMHVSRLLRASIAELYAAAAADGGR